MSKKIKQSEASGLHLGPSVRMIRRGFVPREDGDKFRITGDAAEVAMVAAARLVKEVSKAVYASMAKTKTAKIQAGRNPLYEVLKDKCIKLEVDKVCSDSRLAPMKKSKSDSGKVVVRSTGVALATADALFSGKERLSGELKIQVANMIDAYFMKIGQMASKIALKAKRQTVTKSDVSLACEFFHSH